ncbi:MULTISPECIES: hypothetical protein [Flavobacterium]|uniref:Uncharacterized protein n=1 Tax=Flavobacterium jumunjinense TaxID=998845 RepID=A0ABV5GP51_9FLAO|nr:MULTISPECIES: hypothetical protein [Flavobacterium]
MANLYIVGDLVTFKTHPLLSEFYIKGDGKYVPPIMIVKEVLFENKEKKVFDEVSGNKIGEKIKYICVHFDDNKSEFIESHLYESHLVTFKNLKIAKVVEENDHNNYVDIITEIDSYPITFNYEFGKVVYFKTKKLEAFKKRESSKIELVKGKEEKKTTRQYVVNYITPDFLISGYKKESYSDLFYNTGKPKRIASIDLIKLKWFNPTQQKFTEQFLPIEFFIDFNPFIRPEKI